MADTVELFASGRRASAAGMGAVHDSGGERALLIDTADRVGVALPELGDVATSRLAKVLDPGLEPANPVDAWGTGREAEDVFVECLSAVSDDPSIGAVVFCVDLTAEEKPDYAYSDAAFTVSRQTDKPLAVLSNLATTVDPVQAGRLREGGVPVLEGTETGLRAIRHLLDRHARSSRPGPDPSARLTAPALPPSEVEGEASALRVLAAYGIAVPEHAPAGDESELLEAVGRIGYPVVLKTAAPIDHKTEVTGVVLGITAEESLLTAYRELATRLGPHVLAQEQVAGVVEIALGMIDDPQFGPVVLISAGGRLVELMADRVAVLPPIDRVGAIDALDRLRVRSLFDGVRGGEPVDLEALAELIVRFSELAADAGGQIRAIDVNPVIVGPEGAVAVDALFKPA